MKKITLGALITLFFFINISCFKYRFVAIDKFNSDKFIDKSSSELFYHYYFVVKESQKYVQDNIRKDIEIIKQLIKDCSIIDAAESAIGIL